MSGDEEPGATRWRWARGLRARFVLILLLAVILPNSLLAVWLGRSARASALAQLEGQLHERLAEAAVTIGHRWIELRSPLLSLAEDPRLTAALREPEAPATPLTFVDVDVWEGLDDVTGDIAFVDLNERVRVLFSHPTAAGRGTSGSTVLLPVRIPVYDVDGALTGTLQANVSLSSLLPPIYGWGAAAGAVPAVLSSDGTPLVQVSMEPLLGGERRFTWEGEEWLAAHRDVYDPALRLALAAPTAPYTTPFTAAARRGVVALVLVMSGSVLLILVLSHHVSAPIGRLTRAAEDVAHGHLDGHGIQVEGPDEVRRLGRSFNSMTASLKRLIRRVSQQESAAAVGEFAASLAHEVRNPLTSVRLDLERAREHIAQPAAADDLVARALRQVERLDSTVSGALRLARVGSLELTPLDLREPVAAALRTAAALFGRRPVRLASWTPPPEPLSVRGNAAALEQMLLNLLMNAADAVEGCEAGGRVGVEGSVADGGGRVAVQVEAADGTVRMRVRDDGPGMTPEAMQRALEPFYTTRAEGTGLGLTVVKRIVEAHGGELEIESAWGEGTTVGVTLPLVSM